MDSTKKQIKSKVVINPETGKKKYIYPVELAYFRDYYHSHNSDVTCECGQAMKSNTMRKHINSKKHHYLLSKKAVENSADLD